MDLKPGASISGLQWQIFRALIIAEKVFHDHGAGDVHITSGTEPGVGRPPESLHNRGQAVDIALPPRRSVDALQRIVHDIRRGVGDAVYDVVLEVDHIHIEYDPRDLTGRGFL